MQSRKFQKQLLPKGFVGKAVGKKLKWLNADALAVNPDGEAFLVRR